jgi:26S proteasome regulatory subunit N8
LQGLHLRLREIQAYLQKVQDGQLPVNHAVLGNLQDIFNLLPNLSTPKPGSEAKSGNASELSYAMSVKTNDQLLAIYLSSLIRAITAFHDLIENKIQNRQQQEEKEAKKEELAAGKDDKDKKEGANGVNGDSTEKSGEKDKKK